MDIPYKGSIKKVYQRVKIARARSRGVARRLVHSDELGLDRPIFLIGLPGGGLTLLSRILRRNPAAMSVARGNWAGRDEMQNYLGSVLPKPLKLKDSQPHGKDDFLGGSWMFATDRYLDSFQKEREDANPSLANRFREILRRRILMFADEIRQARLVDKSQTFTLKVGFVDELLEDSHPQFVLVIRNPYLMCRKSVRKPALSELDEDHHTRLRLAAEHYDNSVRLALKDADEVESFYLLRFEDFLSNPYLETEALCEFLEIEFQSQMLPSAEDDHGDGKWYPLRYEANEAELDELTDEEKKIIDSRCREWAERFGYTDEPSSRGHAQGGPIESWDI